VSFDEIVKLTRVSDNNTPEQFRIFFRKLMMRDDRHSALDHATSEGAPIDVTVWPELSIVREDGQDIPDDELMFLKELYHKEDPSMASSRTDLDPQKDIGVGDSWRPSPGEFTQLLRKQGLLTPDNAGSISIKVTGRKTVQGKDCLVLTIHVSCPNVDGDSSLPEEFRSVHGSFDRLEELFVPTVSTKDVAGEAITQTSKYVEVVDLDGQTIQGNMVRVVHRSELNRPDP